MAFDKGNLLWQKPAPPAQFGQYITILGDNSLLVVGGNEIDHWDRDGNPRFEVVLDEGEQITTPPVIDAKGRIYVGTFSGIYCLE
jgi:outer membrane protein assembly factor BamB